MGRIFRGFRIMSRNDRGEGFRLYQVRGRLDQSENGNELSVFQKIF
jgi:hypothetical protein